MDDKEGMQTAGAASKQARVVLFTPMLAPILRSVDPQQVAIFVKERERYELEVDFKKVEIPSLQATPYTASFDRSLLKQLVFMGSFNDVDPKITFETLTRENIKEYLTALVKNSDHLYDPTRLRDAVARLKLQIGIRDPAERIKNYCADVFERLDAIGYGEFKTENIKHTIKLLLERVRPSALKTSMQEILKVEPGLDKDVRLFINRLKKDAHACQAFRQQVDRSETRPGVTLGKSAGDGTDDGKNSGKDTGKQPEDGVPTKGNKLVCLYPPHKANCLRYMLRNCKYCLEEEKAKLLQEYREERQRNSGKAQRL